MNAIRNKDKWDSLSMREKSDMMKVAVQQGIYNLSDIRKAYNEYAEGGPKETNEEKTQWFNNWYSGRSRQLADNYRSYGINGQSSIGDAFMYLLPNRYTNDYFAKRAKESILNSIDTVDEGYLPSTKGQGTLTDAQYKLAQKTLNQSVSDINSDDLDEVYLLNVLQKGTYYPKEHTILYSPYADESDKIHERTHAAEAQFIKNAIRNNKPKLQDGVNSDRYLDNPSEIYSRLNSFRFENKLNPTDTIDRKKLEDFKKSAKDYDLLDRYDDDSLLFLLNDVAHNVNSQSQDEYNVTALGGPLMQLANKYEEGGPYKPGTIYGRPVEEGLKIVSPEFDALLIGKVAANAAREAAGELLNSGIEGTARQRAAITSRRFGREMTKRNNEVKGWSRTLMDDIKDGNYADVPLDLRGLTRNVWETGRYIKNTPERYVENTLPKFYRNVFRRTYNNIKPAVPMIFKDDNDE